MNDLSAEDFTEYFGAIYKNRSGKPLAPMTWQCELAASACVGDWPDYICLPTGAGKTSSIDIAVFALAAQAHLPSEARTAPMRTFLVVDRRTVVSEAYFRAMRLQQALADAKDGVLKTVADRLRSYSSESDDVASIRPLAVIEMRGGIYRDRNWCSSLTQPMVVTSTVDQVGSRLLFRGYGVSPLARPIQAATVAYDSLIILDEAHISPAFSQTLGYVRRFQTEQWSGERLPRPLRVVEMTATPPADSTAKKLEIRASELTDSTTHIGKIVNTTKKTKLVLAEKIKGSKAPDQLGGVLVEQAIAALLSGNDAKDLAPCVVGIMCNMVATAKATVKALLKHKNVDKEQVHLIIGSMRPIDRDRQTELLRDRISTGADRSEIDKPLFVVATQCIEVGADYDFDILVTEAAPLDALIQRFGRLNRAGRQIVADGRIVMRGDYVKTDEQLHADDIAFNTVDPIYGNAVSTTWNWLTSVAREIECESSGEGESTEGSKQEVDFGIAALKTLADMIDPEHRKRLVTASADAPVLLPAHLDLLCQTTQTPWPDPDVSLWLHGPQRNDPEVQVCWRADLLPPWKQLDGNDDAIELSLAPLVIPDQHESLYQTLSLCPPTSSECLSVPLRRVRSWLTSIAKGKRTDPDLSGDVPSIVDDAEARSQIIPVAFRPVAWRGVEHSQVIDDVANIRPGDTLVLTPLAEGWDELGYLPAFAGKQLHDENDKLIADQLKENHDGLKVVCKARDFIDISRIDLGNEGFVRSRNRSILRLHPNLLFEESHCEALFSEMRKKGSDFELTKVKCIELLNELPLSLASGFADVTRRQISIDYYAGRHGIVITGPMKSGDEMFALAGDDETDDYSSIAAGEPIELSAHLNRVKTETTKTALKLSLDSISETLGKAAAIHDWGKADPRFQALLLGGDLYTSIWEGTLYAKSAKMPVSLRERLESRKRSELPMGFRHEMLTLAFAEVHNDVTKEVEDPELLLHLIASHHGYARPWAPVCIDASPSELSLNQIGLPEITITEEQRTNRAYHCIGSSVPHRFWQLTRRYGWWGLVWIESLLRMSDQRVSRIESSKQSIALTNSDEKVKTGTNQ